MADPLLTLEARLLDAGIGLRTARRYVAELREHRDDIAEHLRAEGLDTTAARHEAARRLGSVEQLALPMLVDPRCRGLSARLPALVYLAFPLAAQLVASALPLLLLGLAARQLLPPAALPDLVDAIALSWLVLPVAIAWLLLATATRRRARLGWPLLGATCSVLLAAALQLELALPGNGQSGALSVALTPPALLPLFVLLALSALPLALPTRWRHW